jgi:hypothetical protein
MVEDVIHDQERMSKCDVVALLYDNDPEHLEYLRKVAPQLPSLVPKILIQTKMDLLSSNSEQLVFPDDLARQLGDIKTYK